jgi:hypothetical protein
MLTASGFIQASSLYTSADFACMGIGYTTTGINPVVYNKLISGVHPCNGALHLQVAC